MGILDGVKTRVLPLMSATRRGGAGWTVFALILLITAQFLPGKAASQQPSPARTTIIFFSDHPMDQEQWTELFDALHAGLSADGKETAILDQNPLLINGNDSSLGFGVDSAITVYLHGKCALAPMRHRTAYAVPLGWVRRIDGEIQPFVHVDCTQIAGVIGEQVRWLSRQSRDNAMAKAMAEVILHEWIHIVTQSSGHAAKGVAKAAFDVSDLVGSSHAVPQPRGGGK